MKVDVNISNLCIHVVCQLEYISPGVPFLTKRYASKGACSSCRILLFQIDDMLKLQQHFYKKTNIKVSGLLSTSNDM